MVSDFQRNLQNTPTNDAPARNAAIDAVNRMMHAATRGGSLLAAARDASIKSEQSSFDADKARAASLAQEGYQSLMSAEVARYRAAFFLMAEQHGNQAMSFKQAAAATTTAQQKAPLIAQAKTHDVARDILMQAAASTAKALQNVPPLPAHVTGQLRTNQVVASGGGEELMGQPTYGWRPKVFTDLTGNFFPQDVKRAAGALQGQMGGIGSLGMLGASQLGALGDDQTPQTTPTASNWFNSLMASVGYGLQAVGQGASDAGNQTAQQNPTTGGALQVGGGVLTTLSHLFTSGVNTGMQQPAPADYTWLTVLAVVGLVGAGGYILWKEIK